MSLPPPTPPGVTKDRATQSSRINLRIQLRTVGTILHSTCLIYLSALSDWCTYLIFKVLDSGFIRTFEFKPISSRAVRLRNAYQRLRILRSHCLPLLPPWDPREPHRPHRRPRRAAYRLSIARHAASAPPAPVTCERDQQGRSVSYLVRRRTPH